MSMYNMFALRKKIMLFTLAFGMLSSNNNCFGKEWWKYVGYGTGGIIVYATSFVLGDTYTNPTFKEGLSKKGPGELSRTRYKIAQGGLVGVSILLATFGISRGWDKVSPFVHNFSLTKIF